MTVFDLRSKAANGNNSLDCVTLEGSRSSQRNCDNSIGKDQLSQKLSKLLSIATGYQFDYRLGRFDSPGFCGDASSLFTLVQSKRADSSILAKMGWGEFAEVEMTSHPVFGKLSAPLYCVTQADSYFASTSLRELQLNAPSAYLEATSRWCLAGGKMELRDGGVREAASLGVLVQELTNLAITQRSTPASFSSFLRNLPIEAGELVGLIEQLRTTRQHPDSINYQIAKAAMGLTSEWNARILSHSINELRGIFDFSIQAFSHSFEFSHL